MNSHYYYIVMSQKDFFSNQVIEEILRERTNSYLLKNKNKDFWLLISPNFIKSEKIQVKLKQSNFYQQQKCSIKPFKDKKEFYVSLISTNLNFIKWIKLRLGYFENLDKNKNLRTDLKSDGICGSFKINIKDILKHSPNYLHPDILISQYKNNLEIYY